jgi:hypothetical protein
MSNAEQLHCTAFAGMRRIAAGDLVQVALKAKAALDADPQATVLIFNDATSETVEVDFRGTSEDMLRRLAPTLGQADLPPERRGPGRPKLGVIAREVTLLPRHWEWLNRQPGGASVALRKLVEEAKRSNGGKDAIRRAQESALRFMSLMAGNLPGFEDATRALFAGQRERFDQLMAGWPADVRSHALELAQASFQVTA